MPNWIPFVSLMIISVFLLAYTLMKNHDKSPQIFLFWLFICGLAFSFEFVIFILLESYEYYPHILANEYNDNILGSISSQAFAVPAATIFIVVFHLRNRWIFLIIGLFFMIETLFLYLNVYHHNWWKSTYTTFFLVLTVTLSKAWWKSLSKVTYHYINFTTLFFALLTLTQTGGWILSALLGLYELPVQFFSEEIRNNITGNFIYLLFTTYLYSLIIYFRNSELPFTIMSVTFLLSIEILMVDQGILHLREPFYIFVLPVLHITFIQWGKFVYRRHFPLYQQTTEKRLLQHE
ncbi:hypothetical protein [Bacillus sp. Marseille-Q1617]|uniref:hypothetical protein n=1 Tax=Bacillus sp. Marseille-Q1617 TaxID=2736887 RepID=UPI00158C762E|nr:hypothetical protein [Bacillus sp. Marseille-Q1617]